MATIRKRGLKWQVQVRRDTAPPMSKSFRLKDEAIRWARQQELLLDRGEFQLKPVIMPDQVIAELIERYEATITPKKRSKVSERVHLVQIKRHVISKQLISTVTGLDVANFRDDRLKSVSSGTVRK